MIKKINLFIACIVILFAYQSSWAESFDRINFLDTLGSIKNKYPNAQFEKVYPAWLQENEAFLRMHGKGLPGDVFLKFNTPTNNTTDESIVDYTYFIEWIRLIPNNPIKYKNFKIKYGNPDKTSLNESMSIMKIWDRGINAILSSDEQEVVAIEYWQSKKEADQYRKLLSNSTKKK